MGAGPYVIRHHRTKRKESSSKLNEELECSSSVPSRRMSASVNGSMNEVLSNEDNHDNSINIVKREISSSSRTNNNNNNSKKKDYRQEIRTIDTETNVVNLRLEALGGLCAGIVGTVIGYPLDLIKTRMQTDPQLMNHNNKNNGIIRIGVGIFRNEGYQALYKGMVPPLISLSLLNTMNFASYNYVRSNLLHAERGWDVRNGLAGMVGGPLGSTISTVEHMLKTQMQLDNVQDKRFRGSWHCATQLVQERGPTILYKGHVVNTIREGIFLATYFYTYEGLRDALSQTIPSHFILPQQLSVPIAGGISGAWAWFVSFPLDCVKAGVQGQSISSSPTKGAIQVFQNLWQTKGIRGLYSGVTPSIARAFLVSASRFSAYEFAVWFCRNYFD